MTYFKERAISRYVVWVVGFFALIWPASMRSVVAWRRFIWQRNAGALGALGDGTAGHGSSGG